MTSDRDLFIRVQARFLDTRFEFAPDEQQARQRFELLALTTYDHLSAAGRTVLHPFTLASNPAGDGELAPLLPRALHEQWKSWANEYSKLLERNPRLELREMLHKIGESHMQASWPYGFERRIQEWVDGGNLADIPFIDGHGIATAEFFDRLRTLRQRCGGWIRYDQKTNKIVFVSEADWTELCAAEDAQKVRRLARHRARDP